MLHSPVIRVAVVTPLLRHAVLCLRVHPEQCDFVSPVARTLPDAEQCPGSTPMSILLGDRPVGYYRIEHSARSVAGHDFEQPALGLRSFFIDMDWQRRGLGARALAALYADLVDRYPAARLLALTVNCRNQAALALYFQSGFVDSGELYHGGRSGTQQLLLRSLP
jgi:predicted acetyltransferase